MAFRFVPLLLHLLRFAIWLMLATRAILRKVGKIILRVVCPLVVRVLIDIRVAEPGLEATRQDSDKAILRLRVDGTKMRILIAADLFCFWPGPAKV